ncbi:MAG: ATP synthase F1 subunit gamma [Myxococcales bacterium]|nr:ATP synthase F1 subunit gamma [Myxococcales bacterium]
MPSLKSIRKRISSVKSTQKITRAMKMVAGARLNRAQQRITELRPYAVKTREVLVEVTATGRRHLARQAAESAHGSGATSDTSAGSARGDGGGNELASSDHGAYADAHADKPVHPLLRATPERHVALVVLTSDRGLCGSFNTNVGKLAEAEWRRRTAAGQKVTLFVVGRKGRDYFRRRGAPIVTLDGVWNDLSWEGARQLGRTVLTPFMRAGSQPSVDGIESAQVDAIYLVYNEFKSAMTQNVVVERLLPVGASDEPAPDGDALVREFLFEPSEGALLEQLVPMYVQVSVLRALYESMASELGARMTAMDSATRNTADMIARLTLSYNRARQAAITKELMEIIGGSEALKG